MNYKNGKNNERGKPFSTKMIPGILELASRTKYGMTSRNVPIYLFRPLNPKLSPCIVGCSKFSTTNVLALVDIPAWSSNSLSRGHLSRILGPCGDLKSEQEGLIHQYSTGTWKNTLFKSPSVQRDILRGITFNIDPRGCEDIDDVFTFGDDGYFYITISDVSEWTKANPEIYEKASRMGQTLYSNGKVVRPMLPFQKECSLLPLQSRLGISLRCKITETGVENISFHSTQIVNNESYTYDDVGKSIYAPKLREIVRKISGLDTDDTHEWVAQCMIFYNIEVAKILQRKQEGLLRIHEKPNVEKMERYTKYGADISYLAFKSAKYVHASHPNPHHWGLKTPLYCHATSPIRRFADIVNQMVLKGDSVPDLDIELLNELSKNAKRYERESFFMETLLTNSRRSIEGIALNDHRIWVPEWKRIISCKHTKPDGTRGTLHFSLDMNQTTWKRRMVFRFE